MSVCEKGERVRVRVRVRVRIFFPSEVTELRELRPLSSRHSFTTSEIDGKSTPRKRRYVSTDN